MHPVYRQGTMIHITEPLTRGSSKSLKELGYSASLQDNPPDRPPVVLRPSDNQNHLPHLHLIHAPEWRERPIFLFKAPQCCGQSLCFGNPLKPDGTPKIILDVWGPYDRDVAQ